MDNRVVFLLGVRRGAPAINYSSGVLGSTDVVHQVALRDHGRWLASVLDFYCDGMFVYR